MRSILLLMMGLPLTLLGTSVVASEALLGSKCSTCHVAQEGGGLNRISQQRKTPEGWNMTIFRMENGHGLVVTDDERQALIRYLSDTQGLAPSETADQRAILERRPDFIESPPDDEMAVLCARCHTWGRVALQRRTENEWLKHVHFHVGQYPTIEYQALARDRDWFADAINIAVPKLGSMFPMESEQWDTWKAADKTSVAGNWVVFGHWPGRGDFTTTMSVTASGDLFDITLEGEYQDGTAIESQGQALVYTGYEWRADADGIRQIMAMSEDGNTLAGRWFEAENDSLGAQVTAVRSDSAVGAIGVVPAAIRIGASTPITVYGAGLSDDLSADGIVFNNVTLSDDGTQLTADAEVAADAVQGPRELSNGIALVVHDKIDRITVEPAETIARVGSNGGTIASVPAQFDAVAWANGTDGEPNTDDDLRIGIVDAVWSTSPFDQVAEEEKDVEYAGTINDKGLFSPAGAGLNPERRYSTNNVGNLSIDATVHDDGNELKGSAHLIVTVQRFNDPPIR